MRFTAPLVGRDHDARLRCFISEPSNDAWGQFLSTRHSFFHAHARLLGIPSWDLRQSFVTADADAGQALLMPERAMFNRWACIGTLCLFATAASGSDEPSNGVVYHDGDIPFIEHNCRPTAPDSISCKLKEFGVRRQGSPEELAKELARIEEYEKQDAFGKKADAKECDNYAVIETALRGGPWPPTAKKGEMEKFAAKSPTEKKDALDAVSSLRKVRCEPPNRANYAAIIRLNHDRKMRTCIISVNETTQAFQRSSANVWTHSSSPNGACGVITVATFEREVPFGNYVIWNYRTRKIVTNKKETDFGFRCSAIDESEKVFQWASQDFFRACDYVVWGLL